MRVRIGTTKIFEPYLSEDTGSDFNCTEGSSCTALRIHMPLITRAGILANENEFSMKYEINFDETDIS
uniref:Uncharacterized protein n=1 Tax=Glossina palpalis gambiensis TaxID=67801 RepID=A0A1B0AMU6_9MUSC